MFQTELTFMFYFSGIHFLKYGEIDKEVFRDVIISFKVVSIITDNQHKEEPLRGYAFFTKDKMAHQVNCIYLG